MATRVSLSARDRSLLKLLSWTPATTTLLLRASVTFEGGPFHSERRLRERLQALAAAGFLRLWSTAHAGGGLENYYKLTIAGLQTLEGIDVPHPPKAFFAEISPALFEHTLRLAEVIVATVCRAHERRVVIHRFHRENDLTFEVGAERVQPDCFFGFTAGEKRFHVAFEIDLSTETIDSPSIRSLRRKLITYDAYQTTVLGQWREQGRAWERPRLRVVFLTRSIERAYHLLAVAGKIATNPTRRLVYAATLDSYLVEPDLLRAPIFLDHQGRWQALADPHPTSPVNRAPVRLPQPVEGALPL